MHEEDPLTGRRFLGVTLLNIGITGFELLGGVVSGSLALLSDAFHNMGDAVSIVLSYVAHRISQRGEDQQNTFGYRRAQILAALLNSFLLILISAFLVVEAIRRFSHPEPIHGTLMFWVAVISLAANLLSTWLLSRGSKHNLNIRATYLHLLSDALGSVAVIVGAVLIATVQWYWVDPLLTMVVAIYIMWESWPIIRETIRILMQGAPELDYDAIRHDLLRIDGVTGVHHVHAWMIDENNIIFSAHVNLHDQPLSNVEPVYRKIENVLCQDYHISHVTIQAECRRGSDEQMIYGEHDFRQFSESENAKEK
ncbi:cation diffusion facilitator family transporter [Levilactobacillus bambusae]|uniref:Cation transporter n=1 Tax=Levilactobacillus bambusae TaxID=2024736 RepID=A0A2V1MYA4_9LACO|nr:cation diffusion facilitator family transporter [Levilactobacillus bambusae]PWG00001.1 cation transporter [Levilactobacillus bambusae]